MQRDPEKALVEARRRIARCESHGGTALYLDGLGLETLPAALFELRNLRYLNLSRNRLTSLSPKFEVFIVLDWLDISYNRFAALPPVVGRLHSLFALDVSHNHLSAPPFVLRRLTLTTLVIHDNPFVNVKNVELLYLGIVRPNFLVFEAPEILSAGSVTDDELDDFLGRLSPITPEAVRRLKSILGPLRLTESQKGTLVSKLVHPLAVERIFGVGTLIVPFDQLSYQRHQIDVDRVLEALLALAQSPLRYGVILALLKTLVGTEWLQSDAADAFAGRQPWNGEWPPAPLLGLALASLLQWQTPGIDALLISILKGGELTQSQKGAVVQKLGPAAIAAQGSAALLMELVRDGLFTKQQKRVVAKLLGPVAILEQGPTMADPFFDDADGPLRARLIEAASSPAVSWGMEWLASRPAPQLVVGLVGLVALETPKAEAVLLHLLRDGDLTNDQKISVIQGLGRVGTAAGVLTLRTHCDEFFDPWGPKRAAKAAIEAIQVRIVNAEVGQLAVLEGESLKGGLSESDE